MLDSLFLFCAIVGGGVFVLRTVLMLFGVGDDHSFGSAGDVPGDVDAHSDMDAGARLLSIQGVAAFLMMFGLVGLALTRESGVASPIAMVVALGAALASMWVVAKVFAMMMRLQSSGTLDLASAIGQEGVVYLTIKPGSGGQVQVTVQGRLGVYDAQARSDREIATGCAVRVVGVRASQLVVEPIAAP